MLKFYTRNDKQVKLNIMDKKLDCITTCSSNLIDDIILYMSKCGVLECLNKGFPDKRRHNATVPFNLIIALAIAAKTKIHTSLTDIPYVITSHNTLAELGYSAIDIENDGWLTEGTLRHLLGKYSSEELFGYYNDIVQNYIYPLLDIQTNIHILDCTKIAVNLDSSNYENASLTLDRKGERMFGYKLSSLRGLYKDSGLIEEINFGTASIHDLELTENLLMNSKILKEGDCILMDRGFISRKMIKHLKEERKIEVYIPMRENMSEYKMAIAYAEESDNWKPHPTRSDQMICHVSPVDSTWNGEIVEDNIEFNSCVVWHNDTQSYAVFTTTDMSKSAEDIIKMYELRTKIEEDFRQLKDFWKLEDFKSTKYNVISFHLICVLFGYLFYQLYINSEDGEEYCGKSLPVILKNYKEKFMAYLAFYSEEYFMIMSLREFIAFRDECSEDIKDFLIKFL